MYILEMLYYIIYFFCSFNILIFLCLYIKLGIGYNLNCDMDGNCNCGSNAIMLVCTLLFFHILNFRFEM